MAPYLMSPETLEYFTERGFRYYDEDAQLWNQTHKIFAYGRARDGSHYWQAVVVNFTGEDMMICTGPDPITCFITAELMNWSKPDV